MTVLPQAHDYMEATLSVNLPPSRRIEIEDTESKSELFARITSVNDDLRSRHQSLNRFLRAISTAGGFDDYYSIEEARTLGSSCELALREEQDLKEWIETSRMGAITKMTEEFVACCSNMHTYQMIGHVKWLADDVCRYTFYRRIRTKKRVRVRDYADATVRDYEEIVTDKLFVHDVIKAVKTPIDEYKGEFPEHVRVLIKSIPSFLRPHVEVISGEQIRQIVQDREVSRNTWSERTEKVVYRYDPCLVLGSFVLAGWMDSEVLEEARKREREERREEELQEFFTKVGIPAAAIGGILFLLLLIKAFC